MAIHKYKPTAPQLNILAFYRDSTIKKIDIVNGTLTYNVSCDSTDTVYWCTGRQTTQTKLSTKMRLEN